MLINRMITINALAMILMGALIIFGWVAKLYVLVQLSDNFAPASINVGLCFVLIGLQLFLPPRFTRAYAKYFNIFIVSIAIMTLLEYSFHYSLGVDFSLHYDPLLFKNDMYPGHMSPTAAICFILAGIATYLSFEDEILVSHTQIIFILILASMIAAIGSVVLLSQLFNLDSNYGWHFMTHMSVLSALFFILLGITLNLRVFQISRYMTNLITIPVVFCLLSITISMFFVAILNEYQKYYFAMQQEVDQIALYLNRFQEEFFKSFDRMTARWGLYGQIDKGSWKADAMNYYHDFSSIDQ